MSFGDLHEASFLQKSDLRRSLQLGAGIGVVGGLLLGIYLIMTPMEGITFGLGTVILCALGAAMFGSWAATMIGLSTPNSHLRPYEKEIEAGHILLMVDVPPTRVEEVQRMVGQRHPEAADRGVDPVIPAFP